MVLARHLARKFAMPLAAHPGLVHRRWLPSKLDNLELWLAADSGVVTDGAVRFTAADKSWLEISNASEVGLDPGLGDFAIAGWLYLDSIPSSSYSVVSKGATSDTNPGYVIRVWSTQRLALLFGDGTARVTLDGATSLSAGQWYFYVANFDRDGNAELFINAASDGTVSIAALSGNVDTSTRFTVGAWGNSGSTPLDGREDSLIYCNSLLTADEITWLFNDNAGRIMSEVAAHDTIAAKVVSGYDFDELSGTRYDYFGDNDLTEAFADLNTFAAANSTQADRQYANFVAVGNTGFTADYNNAATSNRAGWTGLPSVAVGKTLRVRGNINTGGNNIAPNLTIASSFAGVVGASTLNTSSLTPFDITLKNTGSQAGDGFAWVTSSPPASGGIVLDSVSIQFATILGTQGIAAGQAVDGDTVYTWTDKSGNGRNAIQATVAKRPTYKANILNGKPVLRGDGVDDTMSATSFGSLSQPNTIFLTCKLNATSGPANLFDGIASTNRHSLYVSSGGIMGVSGGTGVSLGFAPDVNAHIWIITFNGTSTTVYLDGEEVFQSAGDIGSHVLTGISLFSRYDGASSANMDLAEIGTYSDALTDSERQAVERYLSRKYGITLAA